MTADEIIGDAEAAKLFGIAIDTLKHHCMKAYVCPKGKIDIRNACPVIVGCKRRWIRANVLALLNCPVM